jgi:phosphatidylglycerol:prolipoprotein diacylglycerol transferase
MIDLIFFDLPTYTAFVLLGAVAGLGSAYFYLRKRSARAVSLSIFLDGALLVLVASWIGARAYHVALNWDYYATRPDETAQIGLGGLAMRGALLTGFLALAIYARARALRLAKLADASALGLAIGQALGWIGALTRGANYGVVSDSLIAVELPDVSGLIAPRFPLQHCEIGLFVGLFVGLLALALRRPRAGTLVLAYWLVASATNFALGFQRGDETLYVGMLRADQIVDLIFTGIALASLLAWRAGSAGSNRAALPA